jgi:WD40 repeat protein
METLPSIAVTKKTGHKDSLISTCVFADLKSGQKLPDIFFSNSEDGTIRMWDLRSKGAAKLFKVPKSEGGDMEMSNVACSFSKSQVYTCNMNKVY